MVDKYFTKFVSYNRKQTDLASHRVAPVGGPVFPGPELGHDLVIRQDCRHGVHSPRQCLACGA